MKECSLKYILAGIVIGYFLFKPDQAQQMMSSAADQAERALRDFTPIPADRQRPAFGINYLPRYGSKSKSL